MQVPDKVQGASALTAPDVVNRVHQLALLLACCGSTRLTIKRVLARVMATYRALSSSRSAANASLSSKACKLGGGLDSDCKKAQRTGWSAPSGQSTNTL